MSRDDQDRDTRRLAAFDLRRLDLVPLAAAQPEPAPEIDDPELDPAQLDMQLAALRLVAEAPDPFSYRDVPSQRARQPLASEQVRAHVPPAVSRLDPRAPALARPARRTDPQLRMPSARVAIALSVAVWVAVVVCVWLMIAVR